MTPQDHNKVIGIMHLIWGSFNALMMVIIALVIFPVMGLAFADPNAPPGLAAFFGFFGFLILFLGLLFGLPPILAGYAMLRRKSWARVMGIIAACFTALSFPFGTALCVYTMWFLFGPGEHFHRAGGQMAGEQEWRGSLGDAGGGYVSTYDWEAQRARQSSRQRDYVPPPQPPDWRGQ